MEKKMTPVYFPGYDFTNYYIVTYEGEDKITVERRYSAFLGIRYVSYVVMSFLIISLPCIVLMFTFCSYEGSSEEAPTVCRIPALVLFATMLIFVAFFLISGLIKNATERITIDKYSNAITVINEENGKINSKEQYSFLNVKNIIISTGDYGRMYIYLKFADNSAIGILSAAGLEKTKDHRGKLDLAHRMSKLLGVSIIEKT
ncbi:hypothetical protein [Chloracidobacterium aggregatum]|uniref:YcxB-like protein domain-containing protein n=1 Tax=Chloracidobacterium sp. N TaxID=2821540 RepID=A0ABX8B6W5_9BACT|nr:hypothetical protein [Chloracidobacterium aggregatum]QUV86386.1 hypothetical protein J8C03_12120 [Chloracidobacterium sp. 2]QUV89183.1 hypothetical protein J8C07_15365 [Chloracidobacterium sp. S]QUV92012.1 hypothetical protein J8C04_13845 [Chloracidobacterium sp. A]QUV95286.1 hypothetical protein J8C05_14830 [Chloracidobacterium sp. N]